MDLTTAASEDQKWLIAWHLRAIQKINDGSWSWKQNQKQVEIENDP